MKLPDNVTPYLFCMLGLGWVLFVRKMLGWLRLGYYDVGLDRVGSKNRTHVHICSAQFAIACCKCVRRKNVFRTPVRELQFSSVQRLWVWTPSRLQGVYTRRWVAAIDRRDRSPCVIAPIIAPTVASCKPTCDRSRRRRSSRVNAVLVTLQPHRGVVVSGVRQWTKLTHVGPGYNWDGWPSSGGYTISGCNHPTRSTQPCIPPGSLNRVPASAGVKAGMSPLPGSR